MAVDDDAMGGDEDDGPYLLTLLTDSGVLKVRYIVVAFVTIADKQQIYDLADLSKPVFTAHHFPALPSLLVHSSEPPQTRPSATDDITEVLIADLGDDVAKAPYLIARNSVDDLIIYRLFLAPSGEVRFTKIANTVIATPKGDSSEGDDPRPLVVLPNLGGYSTVFLPGSDPSFILATSHSTPHVQRLTGPTIRSLAPFHTASADRGFISIDIHGAVRVSLLPTTLNSSSTASWSYTHPWPTLKIPLPEPIRSITWFDPASVYVATTNTLLPFSKDTDDGTLPPPESANPNEPDLGFYPKVDHSDLVIINPLTWSIVDRYAFAHNEVALIVKSVSLEVSEHTHDRRTLIAVGTGIFRGEDNSARGAIYVFEIISVVPLPGRPETNRKLKLITREEVKGTASALCGVNGYLLAAQGQKVMVRGLKEDQSLLPVAFMDMNCYVSEVKAYQGMVLAGDGTGQFRGGVWFCGFAEEPYKMMLFGKDVERMEVVNVEFLPEGRGLNFVVADGRGNIFVLQYDPERKSFFDSTGLENGVLTISRPEIPSWSTPDPSCGLPHRTRDH